MILERIILTFIFTTITIFGYTQQTQIVYLSGTDAENTKDWEFFCTDGLNSGEWTTIPVPSNWEPQGFGTYNYGHDWRDENKKLGKEHGFYRHEFDVPRNWKGKTINIVFDGSMTDTHVKVNGKSAGEIHQGAFYRFKYDISNLLKYGQTNLLEVEVAKHSSNESVNRAERQADFWIFGGIFRPVYLEILPKNHIERVAINAKADGKLEVDYFLNSSDEFRLKQKVIDLKTGETLGEEQIFNISNVANRVIAVYEKPKLWNCEDPNLYVLEAELVRDGKTIHQFSERFGFRTIETRPNDGVYINGTRVIFKGVNYHSFFPEWGRTTSKKLSISDVLLMKKMNMNAVRMAHYPHDKHLYEVCDSLGMFVFDEFGAYQAQYDLKIGEKLLEEMLEVNINHPSIVLFANGNESGYDIRLEETFKKIDPQNRFIYHPTDLHNGFDAQHYKPYNYGVNTFHHSTDIFVQTEFSHALYDGGGGAGLSDFWEQMRTTQNSGGGFIWAFLDEGVVRRDLNDSIDTAGNFAPDGIVGPYRELEGSYFTIRDVWSPIQFTQKYIPLSFNGKLKVENQYLYNSLKDCLYKWRLETLETPYSSKQVIESGKGKFGDIKAGLTGYIQIYLNKLTSADLMVLEAYDKNGDKINTWHWPISFPKVISERIISNIQQKDIVKTNKSGDKLHVIAGEINAWFNLKNGMIESVNNSKGDIPFKNGPVFTADFKVEEVTYNKQNDSIIIRAQLDEKNSWFAWNRSKGK